MPRAYIQRRIAGGGFAMPGYLMPEYLRTVGFAGAAVLALAAPAGAQSTPDTENGRYTFAPAADGVLRLDTRTGSIASCHNRVAGWSCYAVPDERAALDTEIGKLQRENTQLKDDLARFKAEQARFDRDIAALKEAHLRLDAERMKLKDQLDKREAAAAAAPAPKIDAPLAKEDSQKKGAARDAGKSNRLELQLPDEQEVERAVAFLERAWKRLIEMANRVQRDVSGRI
jgi:septal ring factor EnvC (AmiA/AmiB activator)